MSYKIEHRFIEYAYWKRDADFIYGGCGFWFRIFGYGLSFSNSQLTFSERNGYKKFLKLPCGFRCNILKRGKWL